MIERRPRRRPLVPGKRTSNHGRNETGELRTVAGRQPVNFHSRRDAATNRPDPGASSEAEGTDDMRAFIGHTAWKAAPTAHVNVDQEADLLTVSCYGEIPDIEIDPSPVLSAGFHLYQDEYLLTSLCLYGVSRWTYPGTTPPSRPTDMGIARGLIGESASDAVIGLLGGGSGALELPPGEAAELMRHWRIFVARSTDQPHS